MMKKTLVIGASENTDRYSYLAVQLLRKHAHNVVAIGRKSGKVNDVSIVTNMPDEKEVDTVTLYVNPVAQKEYYDYILSIQPKRIIFNPGTENEELAALATANGIEALEACTLVLLNTGQF